MYDKPVIIQGNGTLLLDLHHPESDKARDLLLLFCELEKSPEHIHTYQLTSFSLWNAASAGLPSEKIIEYLHEVSRYEVSQNILLQVEEAMSRYGQLRLEELDRTETEANGAGEEEPVISENSRQLRLVVENERLWLELRRNRKLAKYLIPEEPERSFLIAALNRGIVKVELIRQGFPVVDLAPISEGAPLKLAMRSQTLGGKEFRVRHYQESAVAALLGNRGPGSGFGSIVLPCGAGKTVVGIMAMEALQTETLILTPNVTALHQWISELLDKTDLRADQLAEYSGAHKSIGPVTVATYQVLTWHSRENDEYPHFALFRQRQWGLVIYDEVHILPAPVFRIVAEVQSVRRLGLTATLVREDGEEDAVFSLVGPKRYDVPWKELERDGWIATANCSELRIELPQVQILEYAVAEPRQKISIAAQNALKEEVAADLVERHQHDKILIIGQYIKQLEDFSKRFDAPLITGKTPNVRREELYQQLRDGEIRMLIVSKVANFAIDLPDVNVAIQVSSSFGSRQEEAQRLGRILRPKERDAYFYSIVSRYTVEEDFSGNRQKFLVEQGYKYRIIICDAEDYPLSPEREKALRQAIDDAASGLSREKSGSEPDALSELRAEEDTIDPPGDDPPDRPSPRRNPRTNPRPTPRRGRPKGNVHTVRKVASGK
ncbi:helicase-associated domain-containing protein [Candidatus Haliotispira prima]|uniref:DNA 3'-5' helicase n=1 Tax=Candidatus Haliotispira prima TaxID=3034016 RepID=A0ABY8MFW8_9SPIO|nr:helicase-associated domain-containing protein [Candidatus Haliotispira prima]